MSYSVLNFNVGVLGHIDSGKTSLSKALSTIASTASFDKNPQSQERGITLDLGFSSFTVNIPDHIKAQNSHYQSLQFTLVDCPGHASLIRTIIGGAQIIDMMMLVIDITKGIQTQTAECLVLGEITCNHMIVILNKIDLLPEDKKEVSIQKMTKKILKTLERTKFKNSEIIPVSAKPNPEHTKAPLGIDNLVECLKQHTYVPERSSSGSFVFAVDHCFAIKGQGTVMTGTILQGQISVSDMLEIPMAKMIRKVKSIQMFKKPIQSAMQGDRVGICVTQFDPKDLERGVVCAPGYMETTDAVIATVNKIPYFKEICKSSSKFHVSILHDTVIAKCAFFTPFKELDASCLSEFNFDLNYIHLDELPEDSSNIKEPLTEKDSIFVLLQLANPVILNKGAVYIASRLETDIHANVCRLAFHGKIVAVSSSKHNNEVFEMLKVYKEKMKVGIVDRMVNENQIIVKDLFKKETNIQIFCNLKVILSTGEEGIIEGSFGQSGKVNVRIPNGLLENTLSCLKTSKRGKRDQSEKDKCDQITVELKFKKYIYGDKKKIFQSK